MDIDVRKAMIKQRRTMPLFKSFGMLPSTFTPFIGESIKATAAATRISKGFTADAESLRNYDQLSVDLHPRDTLALETLLGGHISRLRASVLTAHDGVPSHVDPPDGNRFLVLLYGSHLIEIDGQQFDSAVNEVVYINSAFTHSIKNLSGLRIALLGNVEWK